MRSLLEGRGFQFVAGPLENERGTHDAVIGALRSAATRCRAGDLFVFYYSGHGADQAGTTTEEAKDQVLLTYDKAIVDNELGQIWTLFPKDVRIVVVTDSCNSGTVVRTAVPTRGGGMVETLEFRPAAEPKKRVLSIGFPAPATRGAAPPRPISRVFMLRSCTWRPAATIRRPRTSVRGAPTRQLCLESSRPP